MAWVSGPLPQPVSARLPQTAASLRELPGIGRYTAAAIASICFGEREPVIDGNVLRVVARVLRIAEDIRSPGALRRVDAWLRPLIAEVTSPGDFNQAMMELGALVCSPQKPNCENCPVLRFCKAKQENTMGSLPVKLQKKPVSKRYFTYLVPQFQDETLLRQRSEKDIYKGLYEFPLFEGQPDTKELTAFAQQFGEVKKLGAASKTYRHLLSHRDIQCQFGQSQWFHLVEIVVL